MSDVLDAPTRQAGLNYVGGAWVPSASGETYTKHEPDAPVGDRRRVLVVRARPTPTPRSQRRPRRFAGWAALPLARARRAI